MTVTPMQEEMKRLYNPGSALWEIEGKDSVSEIEYETVKNGSLDIDFAQP